MTALLPLDSFRKIIGYSPFHFWGLANANNVPVNSACNDIVTKYSWQSQNMAGRTNILEAIENAESILRSYLRYSVAPRYTEETLPFPRYLDKGLDRMSTRGADGRWLSVQLSEGYVQAVGMESKTLIEASTITLSDSDSDGVTDTFTCTTVALTTETNTDNIAVYFSTADRLDNEGVTDAWRIEPVTITINPGGTVTVRGRSWLVVKPVKYEGVGNTLGVFSPIDPTVALNYVSTVSIYRRRTDGDGITTATSQAKLIWETFPFPNWGGCCGGTTMSYTGSSTDPASIAEAVARCGIRNSILGEVNPADSTYDATNLQWNSISWGICKPPDKVTVRYFSGFPLTDRQMNKQYQTIVARLAAAELAERICACDIANRELFKWQFDHALASGMANERYNVSQGDLDNPIGTKAGHIYAWKNINLLRQSIGIPL